MSHPQAMTQQPQVYVPSPGQQPVYAAQTQTNGPPVGSLGEYPSNVHCPNCRQTNISRVEYESGSRTHIWAAVACFCCCLGCIPYLINGTKDVHHFCSNCNVPLAVWHRSGDLQVQAQ